jgi:hypothetical protein
MATTMGHANKPAASSVEREIGIIAASFRPDNRRAVIAATSLERSGLSYAFQHHADSAVSAAPAMIISMVGLWQMRVGCTTLRVVVMAHDRTIPIALMSAQAI